MIVLLIFGPKRLPGLGKQLGSGMREFKDSISGKGDRDEDERDEADARPRPATEAALPAPATVAGADGRPDGEHGAGRGRSRVRAALLAPGAADRHMARAALRPVGYDERLSLVEHLDELRTRLIICVAAFLVCFGVAFWQNDFLLETMNRPLEKTAFKAGSEDPFEQAGDLPAEAEGLLPPGGRRLPGAGRRRGLSAPTRGRCSSGLEAAARATAAATPELSAKRPVTLGVGEPFTATFKVAAYAALLLAMPLLLYQGYAFVLPAFSPRERDVAVPLLLGVPFLFFAGVVVRVLHGPAARRSASCRTSTTTPSTSCCRRATTTRSS